MIVEAATVMGCLGLIFGIGLSYASKKFHVEIDPRIEKILSVLPGANCGGCGYAGCSAYAEAVVEENASVKLCSVGGNEIAKKIADIMGEEFVEEEPRIARLLCLAGTDLSAHRYEYDGIECCAGAALIGAGPKNCVYGCLGLGDCIRACKFGALSMGPNGIPEVDEDKCVGCGACVRACPRGLFELVAKSKRVIVSCSSKDPGKEVVKVCRVGCIGCRLCEKACKYDAIHVRDNLAKIEYEKCTLCGECVKACPRKIISFY